MLVLLPDDFGFPALPYLLAITAAAAATLGVLYVRRPRVTAATVTALTPWMAAGGALYALYQAEAIPAVVAPFFGSPAVYVTVGVLAGLLWAVVADRPSDAWEPTGAPAVIAAGGSVVLIAVLAVAVGARVEHAVTTPLLSVAILVASLVVTAAVWAALRRVADVSAVSTVGTVVVFGHTLDGISTAVGYDLLGFGEQTPLSRVIIEAGGALPTADLLGAAWLFVLVKIALGAAVVVLFEGYVREEPTEGYLLLGLIAAVGLGPGSHNLVLFSIL